MESEGEASSRAAASDLPLEHLEHEITQLAAHINAGSCRFLELVAEFDRREGWGRWPGIASCAEWVAWQCGISPRTAREQVRVARALAEHPSVHEAFARGELSYSKVRALTRMGDGYSDDELLGLARDATAGQLERIARVVRRVSAAESNDAHEGRFLAYHWEEDGSLSIHGSLPAEEGALLIQALDAARDALWEGAEDGSAEPSRSDSGSAEPSRSDSGSAEPSESHSHSVPPHSTETPQAAPETKRITSADALVTVADLSLAPRTRDRTPGDRYQVVVHVEEPALRGELPSFLTGDTADTADTPARIPPPAIEGETSISAETARRLACDASLIRVTEHDGIPLSVGRKRRTIPASIRRALGARDSTCRFPGCERRRFLDAHHVQHWAHGGETSLDNLIHLCRHHHRLLHEGGCSVELSSDGEATFRGPEGLELPPAPVPPGSDRWALSARNLRTGLKITPDTCRGGSGEKLDLDLALRV